MQPDVIRPSLSPLALVADLRLFMSCPMPFEAALLALSSLALMVDWLWRSEETG